MRLAALVSIVTAGLMWLALGGVPVHSQTAPKSAEAGACQGCCKGKSCPYHGAGHGWHHGGHPHEYKCVHQSERPSNKAADAMTAQFNALGADGWHLAKADSGFWCFKRPKPASQ